MEHQPIDQGLRLKRLIKTLNHNQSTFAQTLGMTQPNISRLINGEHKISAEVLNRIITAHKNVNVHWLITGEGEMFVQPASERPAQINEPEKPYVVRGKGKLEDLEDRIERLEEEVRDLKTKLP
jgi:transcriptional regulator with XRE-family HTH domain